MLHNHIAEEGSDPQSYTEQQDFMNQVNDCMNELTELQRQVILLKYGAGMSNIEVAEVLDRTPGTIATVQHQTLKKLRGLMGLRGYKTYKRGGMSVLPLERYLPGFRGQWNQYRSNRHYNTVWKIRTT